MLIVGATVVAQTKIGGDPFTINDGSILELEDTQRGVLFPRIVLNDRNQWTLSVRTILATVVHALKELKAEK